MRILLVDKYDLDDQAGRSRFGEMLSRHMGARGHLVELIRPAAVFGKRARGPLLRTWFGAIDKYVLFPLKLRDAAQGFDLVHVCDHADSRYIAHTGGVPTSITCHDLLDIAAAEGRIPEHRVTATFRARQKSVLRHLQDAKNVVCASLKTSRELAEMGQNARQRRIVIPDPMEVDASAISGERIEAARRKLDLAEGGRYLLHVGGDAWHGNRPGVLRIFRMIRERLGGGLRLVVAGAPLTPELREFVGANLPQGSVIEVHAPGDEELWALYAGGAALLLPSLYEGSGQRIVEAQSCGCPVITSNRAPMTEVAGPAALYVDPRDEEGAAELVAAKLDGLASCAMRDSRTRSASTQRLSLRATRTSSMACCGRGV
jgi:glycosyltransferase involved in cell wall biosynthesis